MPEDNVDEIIRAMGIDQSKTIDDYEAGYETAKLWGKCEVTGIKMRLNSPVSSFNLIICLYISTAFRNVSPPCFLFLFFSEWVFLCVCVCGGGGGGEGLFLHVMLRCMLIMI